MSERGGQLDQDAAAHSPYRGLSSFSASDGDAALFFGRDREQELIVANLLASRLTLLYGQSGIGKSSILCAGVVNGLRRAEPNPGRGSAPLAVYVSDWHGAADVTILDRLGEGALRRGEKQLNPPGPGLAFDQAIAWWTQQLDAQVLLILDQFEQYFLHHPADQSGAFDRSLAAAILKPELRMHCLISLREDALVGLDRFKGELPNLFRNRLRLEGLSESAALEAIARPLERYNELLSPGEAAAELEPGLAKQVVAELQNVSLPPAVGHGVSPAANDIAAGAPRPIEPAHLQLVMEALWAHDAGTEPKLLRIDTLTALGGCDRIVGSHVEASLAGLPTKQRAAAAASIRYLVTPSGVKVAHTAEDLAQYAEQPKPLIARMLESLCALRIMRPLPAAEGSAEPRYEVFHDLLAEPMLAWRASFETRRLRLRMRWLLAALSAALATALAIAAYSTRPSPLQRLELSSIDTRFGIRGTVAPDHDIVIVYLDGATQRALGIPLGVGMRPYYAKLIDLLLAGGPRVIGDDIQFKSAGDETKLLDAIERANGRIVLVAERYDSHGDVPLFGLTNVGGATALLQELHGAHAGYGGLAPDSDGVDRQVRYRAPAFSAQGEMADPPLTFAAEVAKVAERDAPRPFAGSTLIDYRGPADTFTSVSMIDVLRRLVSPSSFKNKIVLIGVSASAGGTAHRVPVGGRAEMSSTEIQANAISTLRHGPDLSSASTGVTELAIFILSLTAVIVAFWGVWLALALFVGVAAAYLVAAQLLFDNGIYLPIVYPLLALLLAGAGTVLARVYVARLGHTVRKGAPQVAGASRAMEVGRSRP
jgi:CHASE2 domain-containing sensor protein